MRVESFICGLNELAIEPLFADAGFVAGHEQNRPAPGIEGERSTPDSASRIEPQLLEIAVTRAFERIHSRPAKRWTNVLQKLRLCTQLVLDIFVKCIELVLEFICVFDGP
jgi:hypothetical protein